MLFFVQFEEYGRFLGHIYLLMFECVHNCIIVTIMYTCMHASMHTNTHLHLFSLCLCSETPWHTLPFFPIRYFPTKKQPKNTQQTERLLPTSTPSCRSTERHGHPSTKGGFSRHPAVASVEVVLHHLEVL